MKNLIFILIAGAIFWGCSGEPRHSVLGLPSYQAAGNYKTKKSVYIASVEDKRKNKAVSATITDKKGTVSEYIMLSGDVAQWFENALTSELKKSGATVKSPSDISVEVEINELRANLSGYTGENLKGECAITLRIYRGDEIITKKLAGPQSKFAPIHTTGAFETLFKDLMSDMVKRAAKAILSE